MRCDMDREVRDFIHETNMKQLGDALIKKTDELYKLRYMSEQVRRFFRYDPTTRTWTANFEDADVAILNLGEWFRPHYVPSQPETKGQR